ncbi:hypothetical protein SAMN04488554_3025 [Ruania alba]|uniref:Uncharacterized protein n=1 Tax=Ruania alba TaxID=648782 RepID=A0A1H5LWS9_9MICO|nr:hypothetical protein SAMN04488554_3025 [Ruania alba]
MVDVESGHPRAEIGKLVGLLRALDITLHAIESPASNEHAAHQSIASALSRVTYLERREDRVALELHREVLRSMQRDLAAVIARALSNIGQMRSQVRGDQSQEWLDEWESVLRGPVSSLVDTMMRADEHGIDMRQVGPFLGVLTQAQRRAAIRRASRGNPSAA